MNKSKIEWCDMTWNPVTGCLNNCEYCYARKIANRFAFERNYDGFVELVEPATDGFKIQPYPIGFQPTFHKYRLDEPQKIKKPQNIFVCSMADLFGDWVPDEWIAEVFKACKAAPQHNYLFLTKNPHRYFELENKAKLLYAKNAWFGSTITGDRHNEKIVDGHNSFVSIEPLISVPINFRKWIHRVKWAIIGAETGNRKGKVIPEQRWIAVIEAACDEAGVPVFMKDSLVPIVGEANVRREFPEGLKNAVPDACPRWERL